MLKFEQVNTPGKLAQWKTFADSFDHGTETPIMPITMVSEGDKLFSYWSVFSQPIIFPSWHPKFTTPRNFRDSIEAFSNITSHATISPQYPNGACHVGLSSHGLPIGRNYVDKMGFTDLGISLYRRMA